MADNNELQIEVGVVLNTKDIANQLSAIKDGKINVDANITKAKETISKLKDSLKDSSAAKIIIDVLKGESNTNIRKFVNSIQQQYQNKPIKLTFSVDEKATQQNIKNALGNMQQQVQKQMQQTAKQGGQASNTTKGVQAGIPTNVPVDKYTVELNNAIKRYQDAFLDSNSKLSGFQVMHDELTDSYRAAVQFNNAIGETTNVMFRLQAVLDDSGKKIGDEWVTSGQRLSATFKDAGKDVEKTLNGLQSFQTRLNTIQSKGFERTNQLSGDYAKPVEESIDRIQQKINSFTQQASGKNGVAMTADQIRELKQELSDLDNLRIKQQNTQYQARQLSATDISSQIPILKNDVAALENRLKSLGFGDQFKDDIANLRDMLKTLGKDGGTTIQQFNSQMKQLKSESNRLQSRPYGQGLIESKSISDNQLVDIKSINKILNQQISTDGIQAARDKVKELTDAYKNLQAQMQSPKISNQRLTDLKRQEAELDQQLKTYQTLARNLNGDAKSQQWVSKQSAGIANMKAEFDEYQKEISETIALTPELQAKMDSLAATMSGDKTVDVANWQTVNNQFKELKANIDQFKNSLQGKASELSIGIDTNQLQQINDTINRLNSIDQQYSGTGVDALKQNLQSLATEYQNVVTQLQAPNLTQDQFDALSQKVQELGNQLKQAADKAKIFEGGIKNDDALRKYEQNAEAVRMKFEQLQKQYENLARSNPQIAQRFSEIQNNINGMDPTNISNVSREVNNFAKECQNASGQSAGLRGALQDAFGGFGSYLARFTSSMYIISKVVQGMKSMVNEVRSVDSSLVELQKVTDLTGQSLDQFVEKAYRVGEGLGRTGQDVIDAATTFSRAGYDLQEATNLAQSALVMTNVGVDIPNMESAASDMISILKAYDIQAEESMDVIDKLYNVANKEPLDFGNITDMLVTAGGTLAQTGTSLEETMGLLTGAFATMRDTSVSNGLVMISQRLRGVKEDGEAIEEEGFMPKLQAMFSDVGISIQDQNGELRSTFDILNDLAGVWDQLSSKQKQYFGEKVAGNRQVKTLNAIMQNWDVVADTIDKANNAQGAAIEGNEMYMESIEGRITQLKSAFQELATTTINSDFVKGFVDLGTAVAKVVTDIGGMGPVLTVVLGLFTAIKGTNIIEFFKNLGNTVGAAISGFNGFGSALTGWIGIAIALAGAIYGIVTAVQNASTSLKDLEEISNEAKESYTEQKAKLESLNDELQTTQDKIAELDGRKLTVVEQDELDALKAQNAELDRQIILQKELIRISEQKARESAVDYYNAKNSSRGEKGNYNYISENLIDTLGTQRLSEYNFKNYKIYGNEAKGQILAPSAGMVQSRELLDLYMEALPKQIQQMKKHQKALSIYTNSLIREGEYTEEAKKAAEDNANKWSGYAKESEDWLRNYYNDLSEQTKGISYVENAKAGSIDAQYNEMIELRDQIGDVLVTNYVANLDKQGQFDYIINLDKFRDQIKEISDEISDTGVINLEDLEVKYPDLVEEFKKYGWTSKNIQGYLVEIFSDAANQIPDSFNIALDDVTLFSETDSYKALTAAMAEQQKAGVLSYETVKALLGDEGLKGVSEYLIQTADGYALNTENIYDFIKAQNEEAKLKAVEGIMEREIRIQELNEELSNLTDAEREAGREAELIGEISGIDQEIAQLRAAAMEADNARSALERYRAATKTANQDAEHTEGQGAFKTVKERYEEGKVGTDEFKEGMNFLLGDNWKEKFEGDLDNAYKEAQKIGEKYFGENDAQSAESFRKDLVDKGLATYDEASGKLTLVQNDLATIAETLGISEDAAESLFGLLNSYSPDDQFTFDRPIASAEELEVAKKKYEEYGEAVEQANKELEEAERSGDTETIKAKKEKIEDLSQKYDNLGSAIEVAQEAMENEEFETPLTLQEALDKIAELETAITTLNSEKITIPVEMGSEYDNLVNFITGTDENGGYEISVNDVGDAQERLSEIEATMEEVRKNPNVSAEVKANIIGNLEKQKSALTRYLSQTTQLQEKFPDGNFSATITCDADTDSANAKIEYTDEQVEILNQKTATPVIDAEDNATEKAKGAEKAVESIPDHSDTTMNADGDTEAKAHEVQKAVDLIPPKRDTTFSAQVDNDTYNDAKSEFDKLGKDRIVNYYVNRIDRGGEVTDEEGNMVTDPTEVRGTLNSLNASVGASKNTSGSYNIVDPINYIQGVIEGLNQSGLESGIPEIQSQVQQRISDGTVAFAEGVEENLASYIDSALQEYNNNKMSEFPYPIEPIEPVEVPTSVDEDNLEDEIENAAEEASPKSKVSADTEGFTEEIDDATPDESVEVSPEGLKDYTGDIKEATPDEETVTIHPEIESPSSDTYEPNISTDNANRNLGAMAGRLNAIAETTSTKQIMQVGADISEADSEVNKLDEKIEEESVKPVDAAIGAALTQNVKLEKELTQEVTKKVKVEYDTSNKPVELATGTKHADRGLSLVDDGNGAELIEHRSKGTYELGTDNGPRLTMLDKGDVVHTAEETKKILARGKSIGGMFRNGLNSIKSFVGNAFAGGTTVSGSASLASIKRVLKSVIGGSKAKSSSSSGKNDKDLKGFQEWAEKFFDWAEIRLNRLKTVTNAWLTQASLAIGSIAKNKSLDGAIKSINKQITNTEKAYNLYLKQAKKVAKKGGLSSDIVNKIQNGSIKISSYDKDTQEVIKEYQTWYEKALDCSDALNDLAAQQKEIAAQKIDNIITEYEGRVALYQGAKDISAARRDYMKALGKEQFNTDYQDDIADETDTLTAKTEERLKVQEELDKQIKKGYIKVGDENWQKYQEKLLALDADIYKTQTSIINLQDEANKVDLTKLGYELDGLTAAAERANNAMELHAAQGVEETSESYKGLIDNGMDQIKVLEGQIAANRELQKGLDVNSEKYQELEKEINSDTTAIEQMKVSQEKWNDSIVDLGINQIKKYRDSLSKTNDEYERQKNLQEALQRYEKAENQRTVRTYVEGKGFVYQADQDELRDAQENLENVVKDQLLGKIDNLIDALEDSKKDTNVYDANGNLLGAAYSTPELGTLTSVLANYSSRGSQVDIAALKDSFGSNFMSSISSPNDNSTAINIGDIVINEANNGNELAQAIVEQFPNALLQAMYKK